jgi:hypothetical protein
MPPATTMEMAMATTTMNIHLVPTNVKEGQKRCIPPLPALHPARCNAKFTLHQSWMTLPLPPPFFMAVNSNILIKDCKIVWSRASVHLGLLIALSIFDDAHIETLQCHFVILPP